MRDFWDNISLKYKYLIALLVVILLSFSIFGIVNTIYLRAEFREQEENTMISSMERTVSLLEYQTSMVKYGADIFAFQFPRQDYLTEKLQAFDATPGLYDYYRGQIEADLFTIRNIPSVEEVCLCVNADIASLYEQDSIYYLEDFTDKDWYRSLFSTTESYVWAYGGIFEEPENYPYMTMLRKIYDPDDYDRISGVVVINILLSTIENDLQYVCTQDHSFTLLYDDGGEVFCSFGAEEISPEEKTEFVALSKAQSSGRVDYYTVGNKRYLMDSQTISLSNWKQVLVVPFASIENKMRKLYVGIPVTLLIILPAMIGIAWILSSLITNPLLNLIQSMKKAEKGDFDIPIAPYRKDEIGKLNQNFNVLLTKISILLDQQYALGEKVKSEQLKALQTQINPHFLYNTLDMINLLAVNGDTETIQKAIKALSHFYRLSLNGGRDETILSNEIQHVQEYVTIQNLRFEDKIRLVTDIPAELEEVQIFKLMLQPLVENAIYHGILESESETGTIEIRAEEKDGYLYIRISDDGVGMSSETASHLLEKPKDDKGGYGVYNINERIRLAYGEDSGITYESAPGKGTVATIRLRREGRLEKQGDA
ncbi:MAG: sensor histidine kinase [Lachnospiraceae bacterium]|nr:sensor histidine kinase [Lachnospiraceae bacterium]